MKYILNLSFWFFGWLLTIYGSLNFIIYLSVFCFELLKNPKNVLVNEDLDYYHIFHILNLVSIGVGSYIIKNFTPEKNKSLK